MRSLGVNPAARKPDMDQRHDWAPVSVIAVMTVCETMGQSSTSEGLIVRSIHRHCQFHLLLIQDAGSAPLPLNEDVVGLIGQDVRGRSTFSRWSRPRR